MASRMALSARVSLVEATTFIDYRSAIHSSVLPSPFSSNSPARPAKANADILPSAHPVASQSSVLLRRSFVHIDIRIPRSFPPSRIPHPASFSHRPAPRPTLVIFSMFLTDLSLTFSTITQQSLECANRPKRRGLHAPLLNLPERSHASLGLDVGAEGAGRSGS